MKQIIIDDTKRYSGVNYYCPGEICNNCNKLILRGRTRRSKMIYRNLKLPLSG